MRSTACFENVRIAIRSFRRARLFYAAAALTLAVGMSGATVMYTLIHGILLRPLPVPDEDRLVVSWRTPRSGLATHVPYRAADVEEIARATHVFDRVTGVGYNGAFDEQWLDRDATFTARTAAVMGDFFRVAGVEAVLGRVLTSDDDRTGAEKTVVLSHRAWERLFGGSRDVIGRRLVTAGHPFTVVGVAPRDFEYPRGAEMWTTLTAIAATELNEAFRNGLLRDVEILGRLRDGVTYQQAASELSTMMSRLDAKASDAIGRDLRPAIESFKQIVVGDIDRALVILFAAVGLILIIASANVANLLMMRGEVRRTELAVRAALGATRGQLMRQLIAESLVVAVGAGVIALVLSRLSLQTVVMLVPDGLPRMSSIRVDLAVVVFTGLIAFVVAVLSGLVPAIGASRLDLVVQLSGSGRGRIRSTTQTGRRAFVVAQVALAVMVIAAAGLLVRSLARLQTVDMGLAADRIAFLELDLPRARYADQDRRGQFLDAVVERLCALPGIDGATPINSPPFAGATGWDVPRFTAEGQSAEQVADNPSLNFEAVHPTYFATMEVPILRGRAFASTDRKASRHVAIVSEEVAALAWPHQDSIGKRLKMGGLTSSDEWLTIVGVARMTRYRELATPRPTLYVPAEQFMIAADRLAIRTSMTLPLIAGAIRAAIESVDPDVRVLRIAPYSDYLRIPLAWPRFNALLLSVFALAALLLSSIGLYGVTSASVRQRYAEIGVRIALGATAVDIRRLVLGEAFGLAAAGVSVGLVLSLITMRALRSLLFQTQPLDPATFLLGVVVLGGAALLTSTVPARRAVRINPADLLRIE